MSVKNVLQFLMIVLSLYCLLVLLEGSWRINSSTNLVKLQRGSLQYHTSYLHDQHYSRKVLEASRFDFTPFLHHHHQQQHRRHIAVELEPPDEQGELDPLYGIEKRLVPTGPNPLHH